MNNHLKAAASRYKTERNFLINPISEMDAEVINEIIVAVGKLGDDNLKFILEQWKFLKDEEIRDLLLQWNIEFNRNSDEDEETNKHKRKFIEFEGELIEISLIKTIGKDNYYDFAKKQQLYRIIINKDLEEKYQLTNGYFLFESIQIRDQKLNQLKILLKDYIKIV